MKFCPGCGAQTVFAGAAQPAGQPQQPYMQQPLQPQQPYMQQPQYQQPQYQQPYAPAPPPPPAKPKSKAPLAIAAVVVVAAIAAAGILTKGFGLFGGKSDPDPGSPAGTTAGGSEKPGSAPLAPDKTNYAPGETIRASVSGITQEMLDNGVFVGLYPAGAAHDEYLDYVYFEKTGSSMVELYAPEEDGNYELRMFGEDSGDPAALAAALMHIASFTVGNAVQGGGEPTQGGGEENGGFAYGQEFMENNLKGDYSITFRMTSSEAEGGSLQVFMRTSEGYCMSVGEGGYGGFKTLYLRDGDMYSAYIDWGDGFIDYGTELSREEVESNFSFIGTMSQVTEIYGGILKKAGTETVAGRSCDKYSATVSAEGMTGKVSYCFDKQTGILMKWSTESPEGSMVYECIEFKTSGVTLPALN